MKIYVLLALSLCAFFRPSAQKGNNVYGTDTLKGLTGLYDMSVDSAQQFRIKKDRNELILEVIGQGQTVLVPLGHGQFRPRQVSPPATLTFFRDSMGNAYKFTWFQDHSGQKPELRKISSRQGDSTGVPEKPGEYAGRYQAKGDPYHILEVGEEKKGSLVVGLWVRVNTGSKMEFTPISIDQFVLQKNGFTVRYQFIRDKKGIVKKLISQEDGLLDFVKTSEPKTNTPQVAVRDSADPENHRRFARADSLRGMLTPLRTCYDVSFYKLDVQVSPDTKSIRGSVLIRFKAVQSFDRIQVDLFANMEIEKILFHDRELSYSREDNAVFVQFPAGIGKGQEDAITVYYSGKPQVADVASLKGGLFWFQDRNGAPWIESVCQGTGASLWWPCKDHLSDKPDSMLIRVTVPAGLTDISNGRLQKIDTLPGGMRRFAWYVSYPINNYSVAINIGNYVRFTDTYIRQQDTLPLNYYCMHEDLEKAAKLFKNTKPMLDLYERDFGSYPFSKDGFTLLEAPYPMEHQGAVSIGLLSSPVRGNDPDPTEVLRTMWHESAHEWWGNSVTCKDMADLWLHEAFATYAETLAYEAFSGKKAAVKYLKDQHPENKESLTGVYGVNDFRIGDVYTKGCLLLNTLRNLIGEDKTWFALLRGIQDHFRYQTVSAAEVVEYVNEVTQKDYTAFFDQYLHYASIPELSISLTDQQGSLSVRYKWNADVKGFNMPVKVTTGKGSVGFIYPTDSWQTLTLPTMKPDDFDVDTDDFYITVTRATH